MPDLLPEFIGNIPDMDCWSHHPLINVVTMATRIAYGQFDSSATGDLKQ